MAKIVEPGIYKTKDGSDARIVLANEQLAFGYKVGADGEAISSYYLWSVESGNAVELVRADAEVGMSIVKFVASEKENGAP